MIGHTTLGVVVGPDALAAVTGPDLTAPVGGDLFIALAQGTAAVTGSAGEIAAFALQCVGVGLFEEMAFRGVIFPFVLGKTGTGRKGRFIAVLASSAAFGLLHLVNLLGGFSGGVFLQVGYSFLIGCMLSVVMFCGGGVFVCAFIHAVYNFCGNVVFELGEGAFWDIWCPEEIVLTAVVAVAAGVFFFFALKNGKPDYAEAFAVYPPKTSGSAGVNAQTGADGNTGSGQTNTEAETMEGEPSAPEGEDPCAGTPIEKKKQ